MKTLGAATLILTLALAGLTVHRGPAQQPAAPGRVYELRTYYAAEGKMQALQDRFRKFTNKLFEKHGMAVVGFWVPQDPKEAQTKLIYILSFPSREAATERWAAFTNDPDWHAVKRESEKDGPLVERVESVYLRPTAFSPLK